MRFIGLGLSKTPTTKASFCGVALPRFLLVVDGASSELNSSWWHSCSHMKEVPKKRGLNPLNGSTHEAIPSMHGIPIDQEVPLTTFFHMEGEADKGPQRI